MSALRLTLLVALLGAHARAQDDSPSASCFPVRQPVTIDGDLGEWDLRGPIRIGRSDQLDKRETGMLSRLWAGPGDASATIYFAYDARYLYMAGRVTDEDRIANHEVWFNGDCLEVFLDVDRDGDRDGFAFNDDDYQLCVMAYSPARSWGVLKHGSVNLLTDGDFHGVEVASRPTDGAGYSFESRWPWANFERFSLDAERIGFNLALNDHDTLADGSRRQSYLTVNGKGHNYLTTEHFLDLMFVGEPPAVEDDVASAPRVFQWLAAVSVALLLIFVVARTSTRFVRWVDRRLASWRQAGALAVLLLAVIVGVLPLVVGRVLEWSAEDDLRERCDALRNVVADLTEEISLAERGLSDPDAILRLLRGDEVRALPAYSYRCVELRPADSDPNVRRSIEMAPVRRYGFPIEPVKTHFFPLAEPVPFSRLYLFGSSRMDERARRRPDANGIRDQAIEVGVRLVDGATESEHFPAFDHEILGSSTVPLSDEYGVGWRERDRVVDQYFLGKARFDDRPVQAVFVSVRDSAVDFELEGITIAERDDDSLQPLSLLRPSLGGPPAALWDGFPRDVEVAVAGGGHRERYAVPVGGEVDALWFFYATLDPDVLSAELAGIEVGRFVVRTATGDEHVVPLRAGVQLTFGTSDPATRPADMVSDHAFRWTPDQGLTHNIEVLEFALPDTAEVTEVELRSLGQLSGILLYGVTAGRKAPPVRTAAGSSLVEPEPDRIRVRPGLVSAIGGLGLAVFEEGRLAAADFPTSNVGGSLLGTRYPLGGQGVVPSERPYAATLGDERHLVRSFPLSTGNGPDIVIEAAKRVNGLALLMRLQQQAGVIALLLVVPLLLFYLVDGTTRIATMHLRLTALLVTTSLVPIILLFAILFNVVAKDRARLRQSRAEAAMRQVETRLQGMLLQTQRTARDLLDSEVVRRLRASGRVDGDRIEAYLKEALALQPVPGLELGAMLEVELAGKGGSRDRFYDRPDGDASSRYDELPPGVHYYWDRLVFVARQELEEEGLKLWVRVVGEPQPALIEELSAATGTTVSLLSLRGFPIAGSRPGDPTFRSREVERIRHQNRVSMRETAAGEIVATGLFGSPGDDPAALIELALPPEPFVLTVLFTQLPPQTFFFWFCVVGLLAAVFMGTVATWRITEPIESLEMAARRVTRGDLDVAVQTGARGEVGRLARSFNTMVAELRDRATERDRLARAMARLSGSMDPETTATAALQVLSEDPTASSAALYRRDPERDGLVRVGEPKGDASVFPMYLPITAMWARVMESREPWILPAEDPDMVNTRIWSRSEERLLGTHLSVILPLPLSDRAVGLVILKYGMQVFRTELETARPILAHMAGQVSVALENAWLYRLAVRDPQTGLYVESYFKSRLAEEVDRSQHRKGQMSLVQVVIDDLARLGRTQGPDAVQEELVSLAQVLQRQSRDMYLVSRSGDGFLVLLPDTGRDDAIDFKDRLLREARARSAADGRSAPIHAGVATFPVDGGSAAYLLDAAARDLAGSRRQRVERALVRRGSETGGELDVHPYVFESPAMRALLAQVAKVAPSTASVLVLGETGSGKEVIAELLHRWSDRAHRPFLAINCSALPDALLEAELFGYEKGAFTGAVADKAGQLETADGGTVFLDEIGDMPVGLQSKLLRVLQDRRVVRLGGRRPIQVDVRIVAATHRDLTAMIDAGSFRADLYFRLKVVSLAVPPLRERREDIPALVAHVVERFRQDHGRDVEISPAALDRLYSYPWEGNVRELRNVVNRALLLADGDLVLPGALEFESGSKPRPTSRRTRGDASSPEGAVQLPKSSADSPRDDGLNERQRKLLRTMTGDHSFRSREYFELVGVSPRTGLRDLNDLMERGMLERLGRRRAAVYRVTRTDT